MPIDLVVIAAGIALIVGVLLGGRAIARRRHPSPGQVHRPGPFEPLINVLDASVLMYGIRRALGRPTETARERREAEALQQVEADELARRIGAGGPWGAPASARPTRLVVAGTAASHDLQRPRGQQAHPPGSVPAALPSPRIRLARDSAVALLGIAVLIGAVSLFGGGDDDGEVLEVVGTPVGSIEPGVTDVPPSADTTSAPGASSESVASPSEDDAAQTLTAATPSPRPTSPSATEVPTASPRTARHAATGGHGTTRDHAQAAGDCASDRSTDRHAGAHRHARADARADADADARTDTGAHGRTDTGADA